MSMGRFLNSNVLQFWLLSEWKKERISNRYSDTGISARFIKANERTCMRKSGRMNVAASIKPGLKLSIALEKKIPVKKNNTPTVKSMFDTSSLFMLSLFSFSNLK